LPNLYAIDGGINEARKRARAAIERIKNGDTPFEAPSETFKAVAELWIKKHVQKNGLLTEDQIVYRLKRLVYPKWGERAMNTIRRKDVTQLLDWIEDNCGSSQADMVLCDISGIMKWYAIRNDDYVPPIVPGMKRTNAKERKRTRVLDDDEIRALWAETENDSPHPMYSAFVRMLLLTAQRREKVVAMKWDDIDPGGVWTVPQISKREKETIGRAQLPAMARAILSAIPRIGNNPFVFASTRTNSHITWVIGMHKMRLDARLYKRLPNMQHWVLHDLRRTARTLMARAKVSSEHAERTLGHVIGGIEGTYNRFDYLDEKSESLFKLAAILDEILHPLKPGPNVLPIRAVG
jgi:integrase